MPKTMESKGSKAGRKRKLTPTMTIAISVGILGCLGTIVAALISGASTYLSALLQLDVPVSRTQTAAAISSEEGVVHRYDAGSTPSQEVAAPATATVVEFSEITICPAVYIPDSLLDGKDKLSWIQKGLWEPLRSRKLMTAPMADGDGMSAPSMFLSITNPTDHKDWVNLSKDISISVRYVGDSPDVAQVIGLMGCGGAGYYRVFSPIPLDNDHPEYSVKSSASDADFYTLQPGEYEIFALEFPCAAPGIYSVQVSVPTRFQGSEGIGTYTGSAGFACPKHMVYDEVGVTGLDATALQSAVLIRTQEYEWTDAGYRKLNP